MSEEPARRSTEVRSARASRRPPRFTATLFALGIVFALAYVFFLRTPPILPVPQIQAVRGTYVQQTRLSDGSLRTSQGEFAEVAGGNAGGTLVPGGAGAPSATPSAGSPTAAPTAGSTSLPGAPLRTQSAYDARLRRERTAGADPRGSSLTVTVGAWPPVWRLATPGPLDYQGLAAIVRAAVEDGDRTVGIKPLKDGDRKVWRAAFTVDGVPVELVVDQLTGLVLWYADGLTTFSAQVDWGASPAPGTVFTVTPAPGSTVTTTTDAAYTYAASPRAAGRAAGFASLVSDLAPDGYGQQAVATAAAGGGPAAWIAGDGGSPEAEGHAGQRQVALLYTRGLSWFSVREVGPAATRASAAAVRDALRAAATTKLSFQDTTLQYGEFAGETASTWYGVTGPTLFVNDARYAVLVTGALTRQELVSYAEGLRPVSAQTPSGGPAATGASASPRATSAPAVNVSPAPSPAPSAGP